MILHTSYSLIQSDSFKKRLQLPDNAENIMSQYATCSFAKRNNNMSLWAYYAQSFKGFCIAFDDSTFENMNNIYQTRFIFQDVQYLDEMIDCNNPDSIFHIVNSDGICETHKIRDCLKDCKILDKFFTYLAFVKQRKTWENEEEKRMFVGLDLMRREHMPKGILNNENGYKIDMPKNAIKSIILGHNMNENIRQELLKIAIERKIPQYITETKIPFNIDIKEL